MRPALRRVRFLDDVESEALVERDVALRTGLEDHGGTALARLLKPELDERGAARHFGTAVLVRLTDLAPGRWTRRPEDPVRPLFRDGQE